MKINWVKVGYYFITTVILIFWLVLSMIMPASEKYWIAWFLGLFLILLMYLLGGNTD